MKSSEARAANKIQAMHQFGGISQIEWTKLAANGIIVKKRDKIRKLTLSCSQRIKYH